MNWWKGKYKILGSLRNLVIKKTIFATLQIKIVKLKKMNKDSIKIYASKSGKDGGQCYLNAQA